MQPQARLRLRFTLFGLVGLTIIQGDIMAGYAIKQVVTATAVASPGLSLEGLIPEPQNPESMVNVLIKSNTSDIERVDPNVNANLGVKWRMFTPVSGVSDILAGTFRLGSLRRYSLVGTGTVTFPIVEGEG